MVYCGLLAKALFTYPGNIYPLCPGSGHNSYIHCQKRNVYLWFMMKLFFFIFLILPLVDLYPQERDESLMGTDSDTSRIRVLKDLCWENRFTNPADALNYGHQALMLVKQFESYEFEATINNYLGIIQRNVGDHATALEYFFKAKRIAEERQNVTDRAYALNNIGDIYNREGNYLQALEYERQALGIFEGKGDSVGISYCCHQMALVYTNMGEYENALIFHFRAKNIRESLGNRIGVAYSLISIAQNHLKLGNNTESLDNLAKSREIFTELNDSIGLSLSLHDLGIYYKLTGQPEEAIKYFTEALNMGAETDSPIIVRNAAQELSDLYGAQEKFEDAYQMHILYKETYDSLYREENLIKITQLVMQNKYEQRELLQLAEIEKQKQFRNYLILSFGLVIILVIVVFNRYYIKRKANISLQIKNKEIESQKEKLERLFISLRIKNDELLHQNEEISAQKDYLVVLNDKLETQKSELNDTLKDLTQAQTQLVQSEKMASLGQLTAGVAHELNNPLNFISSSIAPLQRNVEDLLALLGKYEMMANEKKAAGGYAEVEEFKKTIDYDFLLKETKELLSGIYEGASRSEHIVKDLRTFSRMDENEYKAVNLHEGIDSTLLLLSHKMQGRISVHKKYGNLQHVECLPGKLNQVFMNILTNSILAIEAEGDIFIETSSVDDKARISIRDNGKGMSNEIREHIFEPFFTTRAVGKGTGLGLSISYSIIEEHQGTVEVLSEQGIGTEFIITLPLIRKD
jgi:signal transduction histidine kinase